MKLNCTQVQELLADDKFSSDLQDHIGGCYRCSDIVSGLSQLDEGLGRAARQTPPSDLNDAVLQTIEDQSEAPKRSVSQADRSWQKPVWVAFSICAILFGYLLRVEHELLTAESITGSVLTLASKTLFDLSQLAIVGVGLFSLYFSNIKKIIICAALIFSLILIEAVKLSL